MLVTTDSVMSSSNEHEMVKPQKRRRGSAASSLDVIHVAEAEAAEQMYQLQQSTQHEKLGGAQAEETRHPSAQFAALLTEVGGLYEQLVKSDSAEDKKPVQPETIPLAEYALVVRRAVIAEDAFVRIYERLQQFAKQNAQLAQLVETLQAENMVLHSTLAGRPKPKNSCNSDTENNERDHSPRQVPTPTPSPHNLTPSEPLSPKTETDDVPNTADARTPPASPPSTSPRSSDTVVTLPSLSDSGLLSNSTREPYFHFPIPKPAAATTTTTQQPPSSSDHMYTSRQLPPPQLIDSSTSQYLQHLQNSYQKQYYLQQYQLQQQQQQQQSPIIVPRPHVAGPHVAEIPKPEDLVRINSNAFSQSLFTPVLANSAFSPAAATQKPEAVKAKQNYIFTAAPIPIRATGSEHNHPKSDRDGSSRPRVKQLKFFPYKVQAAK